MRRVICRLLAISTLAVLALAVMAMTRSATKSVEPEPQASRSTGDVFPWKILRAAVPPARAGALTCEYTISIGNAVMSVGEVLDGWATNEEFRRFYVSQLKAEQFEAAFWETPPMLTTTLDRPFKYVLIDSPKPYGLASVREERRAFQEHFVDKQDVDVVAFYNLGGTSRLIAPVAKGDSGGNRNYAHFLSFLRTAPEEQATKMFEVVAQEFREALDTRKPVWLSTAGMGVYYTHVRLDPRPKYYRYSPFKTLQSSA